MIKNQIKAYKAYCLKNNLKPQDYKNLKAYCKMSLHEDITAICGIGSRFDHKTLIKRGYKVSYARLNNYPEMNYYINDKIGISVKSGAVVDVYYLYTT